MITLWKWFENYRTIILIVSKKLTNFCEEGYSTLRECHSCDCSEWGIVVKHQVNNFLTTCIMARTSDILMRRSCVFFVPNQQWQHAELNIYSATFVDMSLHSDTLFWFRAKQSLLLILNAVCLGEKQQIPI